MHISGIKLNYFEHFRNLPQSEFYLQHVWLVGLFIRGANAPNFFPAYWTLATDMFKHFERHLRKTA